MERWTGSAGDVRGRLPVLLTATVIPAQLGVERLDLLLILGTVDAHPARVAGFALHLVTVQVSALFYAAAFTALGWSSW